MENEISRASYCYESKIKTDESALVTIIIDIFKASRNNYGTRKIKNKLKERNIITSRRQIGRIMKQEGLVSSYTVAVYRPKKDTCNESKTANIVD
jgi:transposase InsO family protein